MSLKGLTLGLTYEIKVAGINRAGTGQFSRAIYHEHSYVPDAPKRLRQTEQHTGNLRLDWLNSSDGGSPITEYVVYYAESEDFKN